MKPCSFRALVCFDLGGVLVDIATWAEAASDLGLEDRGVLAADDVQRELVAGLDRGDIEFDSWAEAMSAAVRGAYSPAEVKQVHGALTRKEHPGALSLITELHQRGLVTACLSNTNAAHWARLVHRDGDRRREGPAEYPAVSLLHHHFASHLLGMVKPEPAIYEHLERATGARGREIHFFDDRQDNVESALRRGWRAWHVDSRLDTISFIRHCLIEAGVVRSLHGA